MKKIALIVLLFSGLFLGEAFAKESEGKESGDLSLIIKKKIDSGKFTQASKLIEGLAGDPNQILRLKVYFHLKQKNYEEAIKSFVLIEEAKRSSVRDRLALAHLYYMIGKYKFAKRVLQSPGASELSLPPEYYRLAAKLDKHLGLVSSSKAHLFKARNNFPENAGIALEYWALLAELGLDHVLFTDIDNFSGKLRDILNHPVKGRYFLSILNRSANTRHKVLELEALKLKFKKSSLFSFALAMTYAKLAKHLLAARSFETAIALGDDCYFEAADQYRLAREFKKAERLNRLVAKLDKRLRQKLTIFLAQDQFVRAAGLLGEMEKAKALDDKSIYRILYANLKLRKEDVARALEKKITTPKYKTKAKDLFEDLTKIN